MTTFEDPEFMARVRALSARLHVVLHKFSEDPASTAVAGDHAVATVTRGNRLTAITESEGRGRTAFAGVADDGLIDMTMLGPPVTGEKDTRAVARTLLSVAINEPTIRWEAPTDEEPLSSRRRVDVECRPVDPLTTPLLSLQVVRAPVDSAHYHALWKTRAHRAKLNGSECAQLVRNAIERKVGKIEREARRDITLVINVREAPGLLLAPAIDAFHAEHIEWLETLGFAAVWLVGLADAIRLDAKH